MELPGMAELTTLMVIVTLAPASLALAENVIDCTEQSKANPFKVTVANTELKVTCKDGATVNPTVENYKLEKVYTNSNCDSSSEKALDDVCKGATATVDKSKANIVNIKFEGLPDTPAKFYIKCTDTGASCIAEVSVEKPQPAGGGGVTGGGADAGSGQQPGGTTSVQICKQVNRSITVEIPEKGSSARFACDSNFTLYPSAADKIFSADCKKQETLKNMARSETKGGQNQTIFTLTADKKPAKKKLCYLCAEAGVSESNPGKPENYCMIYVESSVRTPFGLGSTLALMLPCVLAALHFT